MARAGDSCDVLVIGGGPAGSTAAQLLASWGHSVVIVHRPTPARLTLAESLPPSTRKLLRFLGQLDRIEAADFYPNHGTIVDWAGTSRVTTSVDSGFHVPRARFDDLLRDEARAAGARIVEGVVERIDPDDPIRVRVAQDRGPAIGDATSDSRRSFAFWRAQYILDCSGRAGILARRGLRRRSVRYRTLAIVAEWNCEGWPDEECAHTTVESYHDGWAWSVPLSATRRQCTVMIDPRHASAGPITAEDAEDAKEYTSASSVSSAVRSGLARTYETELAKARVLVGRFKSARRISQPWSCDASIYDSFRAAEEKTLLVGDAASSIEPLSSAGVKKALVSAWRAAIVTNTCLTNSAMAGPAVDLYVRREHEVYADCTQRSTDFFKEARSAHGSSFWAARAQTCVESRTDVRYSDEASVDDLQQDADIQAAFERLRTAARARVRPAGAVRFTRVPAIDGREVVMREGVVVPGLDRPFQFAAGVDLAALVRVVAVADEVPAIIDAYQSRVGPAPLAGLLTGLSLLIARGALVAEDTK